MEIAYVKDNFGLCFGFDLSALILFHNNEAMKKMKNIAKYKKHHSKKAGKKRTVAEQKARSVGYSNKLARKKGKEEKEFMQFSEFMKSARNQQTGGEEFVPDFDKPEKE